MKKNICCIGAGYVGGPTMTVLAKKCPNIKVNVVDINEDRIRLWNDKDYNLPIFEPGLKEIVSEVRNKNLFFSTDIDKAIEDAEIIFISVNTPTKTYGDGKGMAADLTYVEACARRIAKVAKSPKIVVEKSTLPVRTAEAIQNIFEESGNKIKHEVLSSPEFLAEGTAVNDLLYPDRVLVGGNQSVTGKKAINKLVEIYAKWIPSNKIITTNIWSSELSKLVSNAFLAQRISSINSISALSEVTGADIAEISYSIGKDSRIGSKFLNPSVGFGGSCFQKDILNLVYLCRFYGLSEVAEYWMQVVEMNNYQKNRFSNNIKKTLYNSVNKKKISIWGWAFKKNTNDSRESAAIYIADKLLDEGAELMVYDPKIGIEKMIKDLKQLFISRGEVNYDKKLKRLNCAPTILDSIKNSHAIAIVTEWDEFKDVDFDTVYRFMEKPAFIFDGRKILDQKKLKKIGFKTYEIGKAIN